MQLGPSLVRDTALAIEPSSLSTRPDFLPQDQPISQRLPIINGWDPPFQRPMAESEVKVDSRFSSSDRSGGDLQSDQLLDSSKDLEKKPNRPRPHICPIVGCENRPGFTTKGDMDRHRREVHENGGSKTFPCPHRGCNRGVHKPFKRKENLKEHIRRVHQHEHAPVESSNTQYTLPTLEVQCSVSGSSSSRSLGLEDELPSLPMGRRKRRLVEEHDATHMMPDTNATEDSDASLNRGLVVEGQTNHAELAADFNQDWEAQVKDLKQQLARKDLELKAVIAEKDAQIGLLKEMLQHAYSGRA